MEKRLRRGLFRLFFFFFASVAVRSFLNLCQYGDRFRESSFRPPQSHGRSVSDRVSEEAAYPRDRHKPPYALMLQTFRQVLS